MSLFGLKSAYKPSWDQPQAIKKILEWFGEWQNKLTLMWATGTGKTFTMANIIDKLEKPTLIISHNKTLAAQLATEFKYFFPNNAVHYFVSYFDYYQPESYLPDKDIYIEKESTINQEIEMYRLSTLASLLTRKDVIVISSVSALYGLWDKNFFFKNSLQLEVWKTYNFKELKKQLIDMRYSPVNQTLEPGMFDVKGQTIDIFPSTEKVIIRLHFNGEKLEYIEKKNHLTRESIWPIDKAFIWPSTQYMQDLSDMELILKQIELEMIERVKELEKQWKQVEAIRLKKRTMYDIRMMKETGFTNGIENYSMYFEHRNRWDTPNTIFDYFPDDLLLIMDESHMSVPQLRSMPSADRTRKYSLVEHGFRLPSALEHRPLSFEELSYMLAWERFEDNQKNSILSTNLKDHIKPKTDTLFVSATPAPFELELSKNIIQQVIRPTWLLDPISYVYPKSGDYNELVNNFKNTLKKKPQLQEFLDNYDSKNIYDVFEDDEDIGG